MDEIKGRLKETSDICLKSFEAWSDNKKDASAREALANAVHELRKVASRLEIEMAISEREQTSQKPIPIPPHRDAKRRVDETGEEGSGVPQNKGQRRPQQRRRSSPPKRAES